VCAAHTNRDTIRVTHQTSQDGPFGCRDAADDLPRIFFQHPWQHVAASEPRVSFTRKTPREGRPPVLMPAPQGFWQPRLENSPTVTSYGTCHNAPGGGGGGSETGQRLQGKKGMDVVSR